VTVDADGYAVGGNAGIMWQVTSNQRLALTYRSFRLTTEEEGGNDPEDTRVSKLSDEEASSIDEDAPQHIPARDTDEPDELDALPGHEGSR